jgi:YidC/Oxa1 family membrane protein insertase
MEQRNLLLAIVLSVAILLGFELLYVQPGQESQQAQQTEATGGGETTPQAQGEAATAPGAGGQQSAGVPGSTGGGVQAPDRAQILAGDNARVRIDTPKLTGSIDLTGGRVDDITLTKYRRTLDPESERIHLLSPRESREAYYAAFGWSGVRGTAAELPGPDTPWQADRETLTPGNDVTLSWTNATGLTFERTFSIDDDYMLTVTQQVTNNTGESVSLAPYGLISRRGTPETSNFYILHEGPLGVLDGTLNEQDYGDLRDAGVIETDTTGGWIGITDKYWLVSLIPDQDAAVKSRFVHTGNGVDKYQTDILYDTVSIGAGATVSQTSRLFAGAKEVAVLDRYKEDLGVPMFDKAVDFGWLYFLNKPLFKVLKFFEDLSGNFGVAILALVVIIKIIFFPLANKSYRSMAKLRKLQPEMQRLREQFADDKQRLNQEMMALYKNEGANPASGCLPILIQIPVFFALYKVLLVTIEMRHAPFFGWIQDLSAKDPTAITNLFGLAPWGVPELGPLEVINIGILPIIMGITMYMQQMLNPQPADPTQAKIFKFLPVIFTFLLAQFPAGLVLYWTWNNLLTAAQQYLIMKRAGDKPGAKSATPPAKAKKSEGGAKPGGGNGAASEGTGTSGESGGDAVPAGTAAAAPAAEEGEEAAVAETAPAAAGSSGNPAAKTGKGKGKGKKGRKR